MALSHSLRINSMSVAPTLRPAIFTMPESSPADQASGRNSVIAAPTKNRHARQRAGHVVISAMSGPTGSLEVIGRPNVGRAFDGRAWSNSREQRRVMVGSELVVPVFVTNISFPDASFAPKNLRRIEDETSIFVDFGFGLIGVERSCAQETDARATAASPDRITLRSRDASPFRAYDGYIVKETNRFCPRTEKTKRQAVARFKRPRPLKVAVAAE